MFSVAQEGFKGDTGVSLGLLMAFQDVSGGSEGGTGAILEFRRVSVALHGKGGFPEAGKRASEALQKRFRIS